MDTFKKKALALSALPLAFLFVAAVQSPTSTQLAAFQSQLTRFETKVDSFQSQLTRLEPKVDSLAANNKGPRKFYLTRDRYEGDQALTACAGGYHMASLYEILDPTDLRYNTELGLTTGDSGFGPPSSNFGWIRLGAITDHNLNCSAWTSARSGDHGPIAELITGSWNIQNTNCSGTLPVWCVQD